MHRLETEFGAAMTFRRLNVAEPDNAAIQQQYRLRLHPSIAIVNAQGQTVTTFVGAQSEETLRAAILAALE